MQLLCSRLQNLVAKLFHTTSTANHTAPLVLSVLHFTITTEPTQTVPIACSL